MAAAPPDAFLPWGGALATADEAASVNPFSLAAQQVVSARAAAQEELKKPVKLLEFLLRERAVLASAPWSLPCPTRSAPASLWICLYASSNQHPPGLLLTAPPS
ncbi:hypothetical protein cyc_05427 [Cyclospora cayetanensis]|uniref:Uncharacterized protein n=1 Tax=Cyclospora cayetanensis TaxID=88456 RepID=A0A1D3CZB4_9EIME|nr:hypothetical protein cyc_05427 [Cyclospora cayetanensis]